MNWSVVFLKIVHGINVDSENFEEINPKTFKEEAKEQTLILWCNLVKAILRKL